ncbi:hypothetical protein FKG94_12320 [Exilibacterium tricleocarpae]|uniref:Uncharacterized protein n=1 Tax=Exilibacterium tricleocarpae TaxID=2591008 RepID=A0A545TNJ8_9GAMM|nr:hypothetical protein [Exilibacterium tricleocarpae]TQV78800.1 hypothetical protein FKG94_12320 [Exilibacterium tricleocarpae]
MPKIDSCGFNPSAHITPGTTGDPWWFCPSSVEIDRHLRVLTVPVRNMRRYELCGGMNCAAV